MPFDFQSFLGKYKNLTEKDILTLNHFFAESEVQKIIETIKEQRKKRILIFL